MITTLYYFIYSHRESRTLKQIPGEMHNYDKEHFSEQPDFDSANYSFSENTNYSFLPVTSKVSCIRRKRGQIICLQGNNKSMVIFVLKSRKVVR
jgi:hypothetical protein